MGSMVTPVVVVLMLVAGAIPSTRTRNRTMPVSCATETPTFKKREYEQALQAYKRGVTR